MPNIRDRIERKFERLGDTLDRKPRRVIAVSLLCVAALASQLPKLTIDTSNEGFLHENDPVRVYYEQFREDFGRDEMIIVAIETQDVFRPDFLRKLKALHEELRDNVPLLEDVNSLVNARDTYGKDDTLVVGELLEEMPRSAAEMAALRRRVLAHPLYRNLVVSEDGNFTAIVLETQAFVTEEEEEDLFAGFDDAAGEAVSERRLLGDAENSRIVDAVRQITHRYQADGFRIHLTGTPVIVRFLKHSMLGDMRQFMAMVLLTIAALLFLLFRRASGVFLPMLVVILSLLATAGLMALCGAAIKLPTQILPSFLLSVAAGAAVHLLAMFYRRLDSKGDRRAAIIYALGHSGLPIVMTALTTAAGLASFSGAEVAPIAELGKYAAFGVIVSLLLTILTLPALLAVLRIRPKRRKRGATPHMDRLLDAISRFSTSRPRVMLAACFLLIAVCAAAMSRLYFTHDPLRWFPRHSEIRVATEKINEAMRGTVSLEVVLDSNRANGFYDPSLLRKLDASQSYLEGLERGEIFVGKAMSLATILKEINKALNNNDPAHYRVPDDRTLIAQEFLLFTNSGSDDLERVTDSEFRRARLTVKLPFHDARLYRPFTALIHEHFARGYPELETKITGMVNLMFTTVNDAIDSMVQSYAIALVVITLLMILLIGNLRLGFLSMVPNLAPIVITLGVMGIFDIKLDLFTMLIGSIAIGLAVDDTIHFMHNFRRYHDRYDDAARAVRETLQTAGRAMLVTSCVLSLGFFIFMFATMSNLVRFGFLTGFTIILALLADFFLAPAMMMVVFGKKGKAKKGEG